MTPPPDEPPQFPPPASPVPYQQPAPYDATTSHLRTLSIFYYILAAVDVLASFLPLGYFTCGILCALSGLGSRNTEDAAATGVMGGVLACVGFLIALVPLTLAYLNFRVARSLPQRRSHTLCFAMAIIACLWFPLGTILGVFTLITITKPEVKATFS